MRRDLLLFIWSCFFRNSSSALVIVLDGHEINVSAKVREDLASRSAQPWLASIVASAIFDVIGQLRLRCSLRQLDTVLDTLVAELESDTEGQLSSAVQRARFEYILARESPSQLGADLFVLLRIQNNTHSEVPRFFVDAGCHHPFRGSNTWLLEKTGWAGVAIDANPVHHLYERHRRHTRFVQALLWSEDESELQFVAANEQSGQLGSSAFDGILHTLDAHRESIFARGIRQEMDSSEETEAGSTSAVVGSIETGLSAPTAAHGSGGGNSDSRGGGFGAEAATVRFQRTRTLASVLDQVGAPQVIDFMSLDVEGAELEVLRNFPFERYSFRFLVLEHNYEDEKRAALRQLLSANNYAWLGEALYDDVLYEW